MQRFLAVLLFLTVGRWSAAETPSPPKPGSLTIEQLLGIQHPYRPTWSPDGSRVAWIWDASGAQNLFVVTTSEGTPTPRALTSFETGLMDGFFWGPDKETVFFAREGQLWQVSSMEPGQPRAVWEGKGDASTPALSTMIAGGEFVPSPDGTRVAYVRDGDIWVRALAAQTETRLTQTDSSESGPVWSPDGMRIAFTTTPSTRDDETVDTIGAKLVFRRLVRSPSDAAIVPASGGAIVVLGASPGSESTLRWVDTGRVLVQRVTQNQTTREILVADAASGEARLLHRDTDEKWWGLTYYNPIPMPSPDGRWVAFLSDRDGWDHLYVLPVEGGPPIQITKGPFEVTQAVWSPDGAHMAFDMNEQDNPGRRHIAVAQIGIDPRGAKIRVLTSGRGTNIAPAWSPDGKRLLYQHTDPQSSADLFTIDASPSSAGMPNRLTDSMPREIDRAALVEPELVHYPASDGAGVPAYLFVPQGLDRGRKHPAIVWIHGDGVTQNYDGWHVRRDYAVYYSFHQYLVQKGYVVLAVDYRGSIGYGKEWRQGHFRDLGGKDYQDVASGMDYLKSLGYVDTDRVGVWGLSYGGFMTLQALTVTPRLFRCGIDVAGVVDWRDWYHDPDGAWIHGRMGRPEDNPELYQRTASIERADRIERPLLVLHGTADVNVPFIESVRLVDVLTKLGKDVEFMMYPGEFHYFHRAHVIRDAWKRVERFFDIHLRPAS